MKINIKQCRLSTRYLIVVLLTLHFTEAIAQSSSEVQKILQTFDIGYYDKAILQMEKIVAKQPSDDNWDVLINLYYKRCKYNNNDDIEDSAIKKNA